LLQWASWVLSLPVMLFSAGPFFSGAWRSLRQRRLGMDVPVALGIAVTFIASSGATFDPGGHFGHEVYFDSLTMFVFFLLGGRYLELRARHRVALALEAGTARLPDSVQRVRDDGSTDVVAVARLAAGDRVRVPAGQAFPADGVLLEGRTLADEALLTGESAPVPKQDGDEVVAGSLNLRSPVLMQVLRLGEDTRQAGIVALMRSALTQRPRLVQQAERLAGPFLWTVLALAAGAAAVWSIVDPSRAVWVAVSVLIVTCPCALSLAAPSALLAATGALARRGVLLQRIEALEGLAGVDTVVFDNDLSPGQQYNLEKLLGRTAIDRTAVILDIFAQNAHTLEGKAQVELALLRYRLPRLRRGADAKLSQQRGGVGSRFGSGETKLEVDRRRIKRRIAKLESDLRELDDTRRLQRKGRDRGGLTNVTIVGYTNAGKSTLLNRLTDAGVLTEDRLFATLDPTTRRLALPGGEPVLLTDTVGFVRRLPHGLIEAFKSTLEVASRADLLVHVVDGSSADPEGQIDAVRTVLDEIDARRVPELIVFNKTDLIDVAVRDRLVEQWPGSVAISAVTGEGIEALLVTIADRVRAMAHIVELVVPYERGDVLAAIHREGEVVSTHHSDGGTVVRARLADASAGRLSEFVVSTS